MGLLETLRLIVMSKEVSNISPAIVNCNPDVDLRQNFDELFGVRTSEWDGFFPTVKRSIIN